MSPSATGRSHTGPLGRRERVRAPFGRRRAPVLSNQAVGAYRVLGAVDLSGPSPDPGQFYMLAAAEGWGAGADERPFLGRAFSFMRTTRAASGEGVELEFLLEAVGPGTARLGSLGPGDELWLTGPLGVGFGVLGEARPALLVAGGVGIAPLAAWQDELRRDGRPAAALLGFRDEEHAAAVALLDEVQVATDDGSSGHRGLVTELLSAALDADPSVTVYACGPPPMLEAVRAMCAERRVPAELALESGMACGFGACYGCVVATRDGYLRVCVDGPVIDAAQLDSALGDHP